MDETPEGTATDSTPVAQPPAAQLTRMFRQGWFWPQQPTAFDVAAVMIRYYAGCLTYGERRMTRIMHVATAVQAEVAVTKQLDGTITFQVDDDAVRRAGT